MNLNIFQMLGGFFGNAKAHINKNDGNIVFEEIKDNEEQPMYSNVYLKNNIPILLQISKYDDIAVGLDEDSVRDKDLVINAITKMLGSINEIEQGIANEAIKFVDEFERELGTVDYMSVIINWLDIGEDRVWATANLTYWCWSSAKNEECSPEASYNIWMDRDTGKVTEISFQDWY